MHLSSNKVVVSTFGPCDACENIGELTNGSLGRLHQITRLWSDSQIEFRKRKTLFAQIIGSGLFVKLKTHSGSLVKSLCDIRTQRFYVCWVIWCVLFDHGSQNFPAHWRVRHQECPLKSEIQLGNSEKL